MPPKYNPFLSKKQIKELKEAAKELIKLQKLLKKAKQKCDQIKSNQNIITKGNNE